MDSIRQHFNIRKSRTSGILTTCIGLLLLVSSCSVTNKPRGASRFSSPRSTQPFDDNWLFAIGDFPGASGMNFDDHAWRRIRVPHDWSIHGTFDQNNPTGKAGGFLPAGVGWYRKHFVLPAGAPDRRVFIDFDGVMANSDVWINGVHLGHRPNGYVSFEYEITTGVRRSGDNCIAVRCDNSLQPASRWYSGAGIYRHVRLVLTDPIHLENDHTFITTPQITSDDATVRIQNVICNQAANPQHITVRSIIFDPQGKIVASGGSSPMTIHPGEAAPVEETLHIADPQLWNLDQPNLYRAATEIRLNDRLVDNKFTTFGIREFHFDAATGFWLNGKNLKIIGCCLHHDGGAVGAAVPLGIWQRRLQSLRAIGCNAIRTSHNPPSPEFLDLCDRMGFMVMDEMFDVWITGKTPLGSREKLNDYHLYFPDWWRTDLTSTLLRDRNHPCVMIYSGGNEIPDINAHSNRDFEIFRPMRDLYHQLDPTRPVTLALLRPNQSNVYHNGFADLLDVVGQNYREDELLAAHQQHPNWKIIGTENHFEARAWTYLRDNPAYSGQFIWTGYDYLGESPAWPIVGSGAGLFDRTGRPRPEAFEAQSWWTKAPMVYIARQPRPTSQIGQTLIPWQHTRLVSDWTPRQSIGSPEQIEVFTNCPQVELFLNGKSLGLHSISSSAAPIRWSVPFAPGTLQAIARRDGKPLATYTLHTAGPADHLLLSVDQRRISTDWNNLAIARAQIVDKAGVIVPDAANQIHFTVSSAGQITAVDSGDNASHESFTDASCHCFQGQCIAIIQAHQPGEIALWAHSGGLRPAMIRIRCHGN